MKFYSRKFTLFFPNGEIANFLARLDLAPVSATIINVQLLLLLSN